MTNGLFYHWSSVKRPKPYKGLESETAKQSETQTVYLFLLSLFFISFSF